MAIVVVVTNGHPPLVAVGYVSVIHLGKATGCVLVKDFDCFGLIQNNDVIQSIVVHIGEADAIATVVIARER